MLRGRRARRRRRKDDDDEDEESAEQGGDAAVGGNACPDGLRVRHGALARSSESEREGGQGQQGGGPDQQSRLLRVAGACTIDEDSLSHAWTSGRPGTAGRLGETPPGPLGLASLKRIVPLPEG